MIITDHINKLEVQVNYNAKPTAMTDIDPSKAPQQSETKGGMFSSLKNKIFKSGTDSSINNGGANY